MLMDIQEMQQADNVHSITVHALEKRESANMVPIVKMRKKAMNYKLVSLTNVVPVIKENLET